MFCFRFTKSLSKVSSLSPQDHQPISACNATVPRFSPCNLDSARAHDSSDVVLIHACTALFKILLLILTLPPSFPADSCFVCLLFSFDWYVLLRLFLFMTHPRPILRAIRNLIYSWHIPRLCGVSRRFWGACTAVLSTKKNGVGWKWSVGLHASCCSYLH